MFPPFDQTTALEICRKVAHALDDSQACLEQLGKVSEERAGIGIMIGALVGVTGKGKAVVIVAVSGISREIRFSDDFFSGDGGITENGSKKHAAPESPQASELKPKTLFLQAEPIVSQEEITQALSENDEEIHILTDKINALKEKRRLPDNEKIKYKNITDEEKALVQKRLSLTSASLNKVYSLYSFNTASGKSISLDEIIDDLAKQKNIKKLPPTGIGDCCAPKLLHKAFSMGLKIESMAEIYYGKENARRVPLKSYPPCDERCALILPYMLGLEILYRDESIVVVNKQSGLLSVPGRGPEKQDCVVNRLKRLFPNCIEQPAVHRLDMETSGLMVLSLTESAHKSLCRQFEERTTYKEYEALLDATPQTPKARTTAPATRDTTATLDATAAESREIPEHGTLTLYFRVDIENRPHQIWDDVYGKEAITEFIKLGEEDYLSPEGNKKKVTRMKFIPHTGRTHQLRLASADSHGLFHPIIGDTLYGKCEKGERLMLHATKLVFRHPETGNEMVFESPAPF